MASNYTTVDIFHGATPLPCTGPTAGDDPDLARVTVTSVNAHFYSYRNPGNHLRWAFVRANLHWNAETAASQPTSRPSNHLLFLIECSPDGEADCQLMPRRRTLHLDRIECSPPDISLGGILVGSEYVKLCKRPSPARPIQAPTGLSRPGSLCRYAQSPHIGLMLRW